MWLSCRSWRIVWKLKALVALLVLKMMLGSLRWFATASAKYMYSSYMMQVISSWYSFASIIFWAINSWSGALQLLLKPDMTSIKFTEETLQLEKPSTMGRKLKLGWFNVLGKLNWVWAIVMENPLEWRIEPNWSIGFMWPWNGQGTSTILWCLCLCSSISLVFFSPRKNYVASIGKCWLQSQSFGKC